MLRNDPGFTIVELITTIVVGALLVLTFYQLFISVVQTSNTAKQDSAAHAMASSILKQYPSTAVVSGGGDTCVENNNISTVTDEDTPEDDSVTGLGNYTYTVSAACPYSSTPSISLVTIVIQYGTQDGNNWSLNVTKSKYVN
jgi:prepilin-type N-terminal cleavage/methylation domain-containing protein